MKEITKFKFIFYLSPMQKKRRNAIMKHERDFLHKIKNTSTGSSIKTKAKRCPTKLFFLLRERFYQQSQEIMVLHVRKTLSCAHLYLFDMTFMAKSLTVFLLFCRNKLFPSGNFYLPNNLPESHLNVNLLEMTNKN